jgi:molybdopterin/thiamine biosynthesis adenylyltransferase
LKTHLNVMIVGAGGNGSWLVNRLDWLIQKEQIPDSVRFTIFDGDTVERKNLMYQDFTPIHILDNKVHALSIRYEVTAKAKFVTEEKEMEPFDMVICCVDNRDFRELMFRFMDAHPDKYWLDVRAEGQNVLIYAKSKQNTLEAMLKTLPATSGPTSCQRQYDQDNGVVQLGNQIAATIAAQCVLNYIRDEPNAPVFNQMF